MCEEIEKNIEIDLKNKIIAIWLDESHLNRYFIKNIGKVHTHDSSYGYPGGWPILRGYKVKLVHDKGDILK
jgi:Zn-finger nucleic acid-binding protein